VIEGLVEHVERHLGPIAGEWDADPAGDPLPFSIVHHIVAGRSRAPADTEVFSTLGISDHRLGPHRSRVELLMIAPADLTPGAIPPVLHHAGEMLIEAADVPQLGDTFSAVDGLREVSPMDNLLVLRPLYQKPDFSPFDNGFERVHFLWLIPVYDVEAEFAEAEGWPAFEQLMWDLDVDPTDFVREPWLD
jgi:hypothetical protein